VSDCPPVWALTPGGVDQARQVSLNPSFAYAGIQYGGGAALPLAPGTSPNVTILPRALMMGAGKENKGPLVQNGVLSALSSTSPRASPPAAASIGGDSFAVLNKNPVSALTEFAQARKLPLRIEVLNETGPPHDPRFAIAVFMGKRQFPGVVSKSKKEGKREAADAALRILIAEGEFIAANSAASAVLADKIGSSLVKSNSNNNITTFVMSRADEIAALAHKTFNSLALQITEFISGRKVLAAIIMKRHFPGEEAREDLVVSLGTGNRCIVGTRMSLEGLTVNDCHAEVISRRGFLRFLYQNLLAYDPVDPDRIFEPVSPEETQPKSSIVPDFPRLKVRGGVSFHMYISTAPCGDGALFSPRDNEIYDVDTETAAKEHKPTFTSSVQGVLRTKMEGGEGTIPIEPDMEPQTWDGIIRGERLRTMSCSDKIAKWNVTGIQGALLSHFLEPVYLSSVTLGYLFDFGHLSRALCCRLKGGGEIPLLAEQQLPEGFRLNHPDLGRVTVYDPPRETEKTKPISINWTIGDDKPEVCDGSQGLCVERFSEMNGAQTSQLCKKNFYAMFKEVCAKFGHGFYSNYLTAKRAASDFQAAKRLAKKAFVAGGFGHWLSKPVEERMFE